MFFVEAKNILENTMRVYNLLIKMLSINIHKKYMKTIVLFIPSLFLNMPYTLIINHQNILHIDYKLKLIRGSLISDQ